MTGQSTTPGDRREFAREAFAQCILPRLSRSLPAWLLKYGQHGARGIGRVDSLGQFEQPCKDQCIDTWLAVWVAGRTVDTQTIDEHAPSITQWKQYDLAIG